MRIQQHYVINVINSILFFLYEEMGAEDITILEDGLAIISAVCSSYFTHIISLNNFGNMVTENELIVANKL